MFVYAHRIHPVIMFVPSCVVALFIGFLSVLGATAGAHRLWAHRSYSASLPLRVLLMVCQTVLGQVGKQRFVLLYQYTLFHLTHHCSISVLHVVIENDHHQVFHLQNLKISRSNITICKIPYIVYYKIFIKIQL